MRKGGGKAKGSAFERTICKELSLWVSGGTAQDVFWRSAMSGGRSTVAMKRGDKLASQAGDVSSVHELGHKFINQFIVECKSYKSLDYASFIKGKGNFLTFWERLRSDSKIYHKMPFLIAKQNNFPVIACLNTVGSNFFKAIPKIILTDYDCNIMLWDDFKKLNPNPMEKKRVRL